MPPKARYKLALKVAIVVICFTGFIINTTQLVLQFGKHQTLVSIKFTQKSYSSIPAFTVCYPTLLSMERMADKYRELRSHYNAYWKIAGNLTMTQYYNETFIANLYYKYYAKFTKKLYQMRDVPLDSLLNISIPFKPFIDLLGVKQYPIVIKVKGVRKHLNGSMEPVELTDLAPIEMVSFNEVNSCEKCFTFFSHLNKTWRPYAVRIEKITMRISVDYRWIPLTHKWKYMINFAMHSPNVLPVYLNINYFFGVPIGREVDKAYERWKTVLQPPPYETACEDYDLDGQSSAYKLRSDCLNHCFYRYWTDHCGECNLTTSYDCRQCIPVSLRLWRVDSLPGAAGMPRVCEFAQQKFSPPINPDDFTYNITASEQLVKCHERLYYKHNARCEDQCASECVNRHYTLAQRAFDRTDALYSEVYIVHNQLPDQETENMPEMTFIDFMANLGGLWGMWLGFSILAAFMYPLRSVYKLGLIRSV
ncbi:unnamed protein product [Medioppia subpectinata]|uniref:Uncharacterized protein n=1 Tax=Medioppia subpectinata TaxID=1979941 RepID=A0A7R9PW58_9ACAR|nr:unnamed protein product [Medioppia subpectinata]CAG2103579.1 unnamed protein product [Medioppia subpectinata]